MSIQIRPDSSALNESGIDISVDTTETDPFYTCVTFKNVQDISRQKNVSYACQREVRNQRLSIVYCVSLFHTEKLIYILHAIITV